MNDSREVSDSSSDVVANPTAGDALQGSQHAAKERVRQQKDEILSCLRLAGVARVELEYDGCGDSGQIARILLRDSQGEDVTLQATASVLHDLAGFFYDLVQARHPGWEIDHGAFGEFVWEIVEDRLTHTHNGRVIHCTEHEGI